MKRKKGRQENRLLLHLVFSLLTVQVLVVAMGSVNSEERAALVREDSPYKNIGTRIVHGLASQVSYQNLMGLNVLTIEVGRHA